MGHHLLFIVSWTSLAIYLLFADHHLMFIVGSWASLAIYLLFADHHLLFLFISWTSRAIYCSRVIICCLLLNIPWSAPVAAGCNTAIGGQGQSGCMKPVCQRSSSELWISVCTMLKDASTLSWPSLGKQVLSSRDSCWLSSANGVVASLSPARAQQRYRLLSCPGSGVAAAVQQCSS